MKTLFVTILLFASSSTFAISRPCPDPEDFACHIRTSCATPWGERVMNGESVLAYMTLQASPSKGCISEVRVCDEGVLSGSYVFASCEISDSNPHQP